MAEGEASAAYPDGFETCSGCGAKLVKVRNPATGSMVPVQAVRTVYALGQSLFGERELQKLPKPDGLAFVYVSHFETCPHANDFSRSRRR